MEVLIILLFSGIALSFLVGLFSNKNDEDVDYMDWFYYYTFFEDED
jgi:hypothetical protein